MASIANLRETALALLQSQQVQGLYAMRDAGVVVPVVPRVYRLASLDPLAHPDLVTAAKRVPQGVLCLISALSFPSYDAGPHTIDVALERGRGSPPRTRRRASSGSQGGFP